MLAALGEHRERARAAGSDVRTTHAHTQKSTPEERRKQTVGQTSSFLLKAQPEDRDYATEAVSCSE